jgi:sulfate permease, SulP family
VLLVITLGAGSLASPIPHAVLAGILLKVGLEIIDWSFIARAPMLSLRTTGLMWLVLLLTVFWDLITAVVVGVFVANILTIKRQSELQLQAMRARSGGDGDHHDLNPGEQELLRQAGDQLLLLQLSGPLSFGASKYLTQLLSSSASFQTLVLDLSEVPLLGVTAALAIETICFDCREQQRRVVIAAAAAQPLQRLMRLQVPAIEGVELADSRHAALVLAQTGVNRAQDSST